MRTQSAARRTIGWMGLSLSWALVAGYVLLLGVNTVSWLTSQPQDVAHILALPGVSLALWANLLIFVVVSVVFAIAVRATYVVTVSTRKAPTAAKRSVSIVSPSAKAGGVSVTLPASAQAQSEFVPRIFISHSSHDNAFGVALAENLKQQGLDVWYDADAGLQGSDEWQQRIQHELTQRNIFIVLLTQQALASPWVALEIDTALMYAVSNARTVLIPVMVRQTDVWPFLARYQIVRYDSLPQAEAFADLLTAIRLGSSRKREVAAARRERVAPFFDLYELPVPERFIGRQADLDKIMAQLSPERGGSAGLASVTALRGMGGIGKSALAGVAVQVAYATNRFPDGIGVVRCNELRDPVTIIKRTLARFDALGAEPEEETLAELEPLLDATFHGRTMLVVLDNVEPGWDPSPVTQRLRKCGAAVLITSRAPLPTAAATAEQTITLDVLPSDDALSLFASTLGRPLEAADAIAAAREIVMAVGYHTLAVRLAGAKAARERGRSLRSLAQEYTQNPRLGTALGDASEGVEVVLESSVASLSREARGLLIGLGAFATSDIGRRAVLSLATGLGTAAPADALQELVDLGLAEPYDNAALPEESDHERLRLHPLVEAFLRDRFDGNAAETRGGATWGEREREAAQKAVATWYSTVDEDPDITLDLENMLGALDWAIEAHEDRLTAYLCNDMAMFWRRRSRTSDRERYLPTGIAAAERLLAQERIRFHIRLLASLRFAWGEVLLLLGQVSEARQMAELSLQACREVNDRQGEGSALGMIGRLALQEGDLATARSSYERYLELVRAEHDQYSEGVALGNLGELAMQEGNLATAKANFTRYMQIMQEIQQPHEEGVALGMLAQLNMREGDLDAAKANLERSLEIMREIPDPREEGVALGNLGNLALLLGDVSAAKTYFEEAAEVMRAVGDQRQIGTIIGRLGEVALLEGDRATAKANFERSGEIMRAARVREGEEFALSGLGRVALDEGELATAKAYFEQAIEISQEIHDVREEGLMYGFLAQTQAALGELDAAVSSYNLALQALQQAGITLDLATIMSYAGKFLLEHNLNGPQGCRLLATSAALYEQLGQPDAARRVREWAEKLGCESLKVAIIR